MTIVNLKGQKFGRLTVIGLDHSDGHSKFWRCRCDCGNEHVVRTQHLRNGNVRSCGCLSKEVARDRGLKSKIGERSRRHGEFGTKLYNVWAGMVRRCENEHHKYYPDYGGRGIKICPEWRNDYVVFRDWAIPNGYEEGFSIDRIDVNGDYEPENCRFIPLSEQNLNKRNNIRVVYQGEMVTLSQLIKKFKLKSSTTYKWHHDGLSFDEILLRSKL